jgi:hypothetical protein
VEVRVEDPHLGDPVDGQAVALGGAPDRLGVGAVVDAEGLLRSSVTSEWTQVTPSLALTSTTAMQALAPCSSAGICRPSAKVRSTT